MEQESAYLMTLETAASYHIQLGTLELYDASGTLSVRFQISQPSLAGTSWKLTDLSPTGDSVITPIAGTLITANFGKDGVLNGSAGCNQYGADYHVDGNTLKFEPAVSTRMFCSDPEGLMDQEISYLTNLEAAATYQISGDFLQIMDENGRLLLSFQRAENPSPDLIGVYLAGTSWKWLEFDSSDGEVIAPHNSDEYTLTFKEDGGLEIQADCNFVEGSYVVDGDSLIIQLGSPGPALCSPGSLSDRYMQLIGDATTYLFTENSELAISVIYDSGILFFVPAK
jgi:heat shock protein HslJ